MSQSPSVAQNSPNMDRYAKAWSATNRMIRQGSSFSGNEENACFVNLRNGRFADVSATSRLNLPEDGRAIATVDWDHDGDLDVWMTFRTGPRVRYFENRYPVDGRSLQFRMEGQTCNRDAIGARVEVWLEGRTTPRIRTVRAGHGYLGQSPSDVHIGISPNERIKEVIVRWPDNRVQVIPEVEVVAGRRYLLVQGESPEELPQRTERVTLQLLDVNIPVETESSRTMLIARLPLPIDLASLEITTMHKNKNATKPTSPIYVVLWATWCQPCLLELAHLSKIESQVRQLGLRVVAVNVDSMSGSKKDKAHNDANFSEPYHVLQQLNFPFESALAPPHFVPSLDVMQRTILDRERPLPVPCSFLIDENGQLAAFYKGTPDWQQLRTDVKSLNSEPDQRRVIAVPFSGQWLAAPSATDPMRIAISLYDAGLMEQAIAYTQKVEQYVAKGEGAKYMNESLRIKQRAKACSLRGVILLELNRPREAISPLLVAAELQTNDLRVRMKLGEAYAKTGSPQLAVQHLLQAADLAPNDPDIHYDLAVSLTAIGRTTNAIPHYRRSLELKPDWPPAANNLAWILSTHPDATVRDGETAVVLAKEVCRRVNYRDPTALDTLAVALAETGNFAEAVKAVERALHLARAQKKSSLVESLQRRQTLFENRKAFRDKM